MELAKQHIDIGLNTNQLQPMLEFWQRVIGLPFEHVQPLRRGVKQHRHELMGSVLKLNHHREVLAPHAASGYRELLIAREGLLEPHTQHDPDGNRVTLVPPGMLGVTRIGVKLGVRDPAAQRDFFARALELQPLADDRFAAGDSVIVIEHAPDATGDVSMDGGGYRYITFQVAQVDRAHARAREHGAREGLAPLTLGDVARISMIRDPDGNWIELSQRASITGSLASD